MAADQIASAGRAPGVELAIAWLPPAAAYQNMRQVLPTTVPRLAQPPVRLRPFEAKDKDRVAPAASGTLIPLVTTVPSTGRAEDVKAYLQRQHDRLGEGAG